MAIDAGRMRHRITFQRRVPKTDDWEDCKTIWAAIVPVSAREVINQVREVLVTHKILCRYTAGIDQTMQITWKDRTFRIVSIINYDERNADMTIVVEELTNGRSF